MMLGGRIRFRPGMNQPVMAERGSCDVGPVAASL